MVNAMSKTEMLKVLRLLSAIESVMLANKQTIPDYLFADIDAAVVVLERVTADDIFRMAREAGLVGGPVYAKGVEAFASLVAACEREACAKVAEEYATGESRDYSENFAEEIRARGEKV